MTKYVQMYNLHLINGDVIPFAEDYELKGDKTLMNWFTKADESSVFLVKDLILGSAYIPKKNVVYITTAGVEERLVIPE